MDPHKATLMQMQIKNNATDLQDYMKGLESWEKDIKEKDLNLIRQKPILKEHLPPIRSQNQQKKKKKKAKLVSKPVGNSRISSYDYRSWDKFDVDKACEDVEYRVQSASSSSSCESTDDEEEEEKRKQHAVKEKEKGNAHFKQRKYELAVESYSRAMELDPDNAVFPANRAMALLKLNRFAVAEEDCTLALGLDSSYVKAYLRRGTARCRLSKFAQGRLDFETVLKFEPSNSLALMELEKLDKEIGTSGMRYIRTVKRPDHLKSKKPLKRISIEDIGMDTTLAPSHSHDHLTQQATPLPSDAQKATPLPSLPSSSPAETSAAPSAIATTEEPRPIGNIVVDTIPPSHNIQVSSNQMENSVPDSLVPGGSDSPHSVVHNGVRGGDVCMGGEMKDSVTATKMTVVSTEEVVMVDGPMGQGVGSGGLKKKHSLPPVPVSSFQFQADWKQLKGNESMLAQYFKAIPPTKYPVLLQQSLETDTFHDIITILQDYYIKGGEGCVEQLSGLSKVKRFSVAIMFLSKQQKECLCTLFRDLLCMLEDDKTKQRLLTLAKQFSVSL